MWSGGAAWISMEEILEKIRRMTGMGFVALQGLPMNATRPITGENQSKIWMWAM